jgi:alpha-L-fucosidase
MEERLVEIGDWLEVNGEAIYGTTTHRETCQWTDGQVQQLGKGSYRVKYDVNKLLKNPDEGMARKEAVFTRKGDTLYAVCAVFPDDQLVLRSVQAADDATVTLLGAGQLDWEQSGDDLVITMPKINPSKMPCKHAWTFKVSAVAD